MSELREKIHDIGVDIATLAVREYVGEAEDYIREFAELVDQILALYSEQIDAMIQEAKKEIIYGLFEEITDNFLVQAKPDSRYGDWGAFRESK